MTPKRFTKFTSFVSFCTHVAFKTRPNESKLYKENMKEIIILFISMSVCSMVLSQESASHKSNVSSCAKLLPSDQNYHLMLSTSIDTGEEEQDLNWSIKMDDGKGEEKSDIVDDEKDKKIEPFIECLLGLLQ